MTTRNLRGLCARIWKTTKANACRLIAEGWVCQVRLNEGLNEDDRLEWANCCFMLYGCLYFRISAYAALKMNIGIRWYNESCARLCRNVTQVVTWPITSYGGAGGKSPAPRAPINRFGKKISCHFNIEIENPIHWFNFWTSVILSERPYDDNHYSFSVFTYFSSENIRSCWYSSEIRFFSFSLSAVCFSQENQWSTHD